MNQLALSTDLTVITAEIIAHKGMMSQNVFEIGARFKHAKESLVPHGEWESYCDDICGITSRNARRYINVYTRFSNRTLVSDMGLKKMDMLTAFDDEELETPAELPSGDIKKPIDMSQKEIEQYKQAQRLAERRADEAEASKALALAEHTQQQASLLAQIEQLKGTDPDSLQRIAELELQIGREHQLALDNIRLQVDMKNMERDFTEKITKKEDSAHSIRKLRESLRNMVSVVTSEQSNAKYHYSLVVGQKGANEAVQAFIQFFDPLIQDVFKTWQNVSTISESEVSIDERTRLAEPDSEAFKED